MKVVEIYVRDVNFDSNGNRVIVAVPNNHLSVSEGDCFFSCYEIDHEDILSAAVEPRRLNITSVSLRVDKIDLGQGRFFSRVEPGYTAGFYLVGNGEELIEKGCFLSTEIIST